YSVASDFEETAIWDENNAYIPLGASDPFFSVPSLLAGGTQAQRDVNIALPGIAPVSSTEGVTVRLRGGSDLAADPDHRTLVWVNNDSSGGADFTWNGETLREQEFPVSQSVLTSATVVHFSLPGIPGLTLDRQYLDSVTVRYRRSFTASGELLAFSY